MLTSTCSVTFEHFQRTFVVYGDVALGDHLVAIDNADVLSVVGWGHVVDHQVRADYVLQVLPETEVRIV